MSENFENDRHYTGEFQILGETITGELIYNKQNGIIIVNLIKELGEKEVFGKSYGPIPIIKGKLNSGTVVTLFNNRCTQNHTQAFSTQQLCFVAQSMIWSKSEAADTEYNEMVCVLKNAYEWSGLTAFEKAESGIKAKAKFEEKSYNWFGAKITFSTFLDNYLMFPPTEEETKIVQRLIVKIETPQKENVEFFINIRNKIVSLISFAIKNNVNVKEQYLLDYDNYYLLGDKFKDYYKYYLYTSEPSRDIMKINSWDYNFKLDDLPTEKDLNNVLDKLEPIFNLYLSLFKYQDMPFEMVFLNMVQALETFHSRFFYDNQKEKYIESVKNRFGNLDNFEMFSKLLLCDTQMDENCGFIILVSRLNDLLIMGKNGLFHKYYITNANYAQTMADTRHYYTHYGKSKENKALKGDDLLEAIYVLRVLLEYHVCLVLGIDKYDSIAKELGTHYEWRQLAEEQNAKVK